MIRYGPAGSETGHIIGNFLFELGNAPMEELRTFPCLSHEGFESGLTTHNFFLDLLGREVVDIRMGVSKIPEIEPGRATINRIYLPASGKSIWQHLGQICH